MAFMNFKVAGYNSSRVMLSVPLQDLKDGDIVEIQQPCLGFEAKGDISNTIKKFEKEYTSYKTISFTIKDDTKGDVQVEISAFIDGTGSLKYTHHLGFTRCFAIIEIMDQQEEY